MSHRGLIPVTSVVSACQVVVEHDEVRLYLDCGEAESKDFHRGPEKLTFSHNSGIFVANAGSTGLDKFVVSESLILMW